MSKQEKFWDKTASSYDRAESGDSATYKRIMEKVDKYLDPNKNALEIGCGTGLITGELAPRLWEIDALDISSNMIAIAVKKAETSGTDNIHFIHGQVFSPQLDKETYDLIFAFYLIHLLDDPEGTVQRAKSLLKPGGYFISVTPCMGSMPLFNILIKLAGKLGLVPEIHSFTEAQLHSLFIDQGFTVVESENVKSGSKEILIAAQKSQ